MPAPDPMPLARLFLAACEAIWAARRRTPASIGGCPELDRALLAGELGQAAAAGEVELERLGRACGVDARPVIARWRERAGATAKANAPPSR